MCCYNQVYVIICSLDIDHSSILCSIERKCGKCSS
eukprot:UN10412